MRTALILAAVAQLLGPASKTRHAVITPTPAEVNGKAGGKLALFVDVAPKPGIHVYAPGSNDYIPITVKLNAQPFLKVGKIAYPKSEIMTFADEQVPVFEKPFRLTQDVTLDKSLKAGENVTIAGTVNYQACDD